MMSALGRERIQQIAARLGSAEVERITERYLRYTSLPGPLVAIVGGSGRGKSSVFSVVTGMPSPPPGRPAVAYGTHWNTVIYGLAPANAHYVPLHENRFSDIAVVETPSIDEQAGFDEAAALVQLADVVILATQAIQACTSFEEEFLTTAVKHSGLIVVLTKADQLATDDPEEFYAVEEFVQSFLAERDLRTLATLTLGRGEDGGETSSVEYSFPSWWETTGIGLVRQARVTVSARYFHWWLSETSRLIDNALDDVEEELSSLQSSVTKAEAFGQANILVRRLDNALASLTVQAMSAAKPVLHSGVLDVQRKFAHEIREADVASEQFRNSVEDNLRRRVETLYSEVCKKTRDLMVQRVADIEDAVNQLWSLLNRLSQELGVSAPPLPKSAGKLATTTPHDAHVSVPPVELPSSDKNLLTATVATGLAAVVGSGVLLLTGAGIIPILLSGLFGGRQLLVAEQMSESQAVKLRNLWREAIDEALWRAEQDLALSIEDAWRLYALDVREQYVDPARSFLTRVATTSVPSHSQDDRRRLNDLKQRRDSLTSLQKDLGALVKRDTSSEPTEADS